MTIAGTSGPEAHWRAALAEGRFLLQRAGSSGTVYFPPRLAEPGTGETDLEWIEASGMGMVYSMTIVAQKPPAPPDNVVLVVLDEGSWLMSFVDRLAPAALHIGLFRRARTMEAEVGPLLVLAPAGRAPVGGNL